MNLKKMVWVLALSLVSCVTFAQTGFDDDVDDEVQPAATINNNSLMLTGATAIAGFYLLRIQNKKA